jgi:hypothetical protein
MIEFDFGAQRFPALRRVTLLARNVEPISVRTMKRSVERDLLTERNTPWHEDEAKERKGPGI